MVLSDETLDNLNANDPESAELIRKDFVYWDDIAVHYRNAVVTSTGHGFCGIGRKRLLNILQDRARALGVRLAIRDRSARPCSLSGLRPHRRGRWRQLARAGGHADIFKPDIDVRACKYVWLGTHQKFDDAFTFIFEETEHGWIWAHAYQFDADTATFIVECSEATWRSAGFDRMGVDETIAACEKIFARNLGGHKLMSNARHLRGSAWLNFNRVLCERWSYRNIVLLGDAAATAHFSVGSGSKLAMESAIALANYLHSEPSMQAAFKRYEDERRLEVLRLQNAARNSTEWFEDVERYLHLDPVQFNYSLLTRSQRISHENLRQRDSAWLAGAEKWFEQKATGRTPQVNRAPMFVPFRVRGVELKNRVVVSPMAQYRAVDGMPNDWHFVHYAERAKGGAGLVFTEMTCVSPEGRITPGCTGLYRDEHEQAWKRIVDFVHAETDAKIAIQLGHSGAERLDPARLGDLRRAAAAGNWQVMRPVAGAVEPGQPDAARDDARRHGQGARRIRARRGDGGARRLRLARAALRARLPDVVLHHAADQQAHRRLRRQPGKPHALPARSVSRGARGLAGRQADLGAHFRQRLGRAGRHHAARRGRDFAHAGARPASISSTSRPGRPRSSAKPVYGRMFQTPFSDRIRNEAGVATLAVGNIYEPDHVNSILMAGRADLVCLARPHLADPYWTLHAAADLALRRA